MRLVPVLAMVGVATFGLVEPAHAQSANGIVNVSVNVPGRCDIDVVVGVSFGSVNVPLAANDDANGSVHVQCNFNTFVTLTLDNGQAHNGTTRRMSTTLGASTFFLEYELYQDAARTVLWGSNLRNVPRVPGRTWQVFGRIPAGAGTNAGPGVHTDTIVLTAAW